MALSLVSDGGRLVADGAVLGFVSSFRLLLGCLAVFFVCGGILLREGIAPKRLAVDWMLCF